MASCYRCGKPITGQELRQRRQVYTGESFWVLRARYRQSSHRTHYGMRIVCAQCASGLDWRKGAFRSRASRVKWLLTMLVLLVSFLAGMLAVMRLLGF
jgi:hypothetical protein